MAPEHDDVIRLTLPADQDLVPVLTVCVRVLGIRFGLSEDELDRSQSTAADAVGELIEGRSGPIEIELELTKQAVRLRMTAGDDHRTIDLPAA